MLKRRREEIQTGTWAAQYNIQTVARKRLQTSNKRTAVFQETYPSVTMLHSLYTHTHTHTHTHTCTSCQCVSLLTPSVKCDVEWRSRSCERWWPRCGTWPGLGSPRWGWWRFACCGPHSPSWGCGPCRQWTPAWLCFKLGEQSPRRKRKEVQMG